MRKTLRLAIEAVLLVFSLVLPAAGQYATLTGTLSASNGLPASDFTISFTPTQWFFIAGTGVTINTTTFCGTSTDGSVVGITNPLTANVVTPAFTGTLPAGNYYVEYTWYTALGTETLAGPESIANLTATGELLIAAPVTGVPAGAEGMKVYIGATSGGETLQGSTVGSATYTQSVPLVSGVSPPGTNTTVCKQVANDAGWPTGTGYKVSVADSGGNTLPGYPMTWQLLGPNTTINLSNGLPYYNGVVTYPVPILASPLNHAAQSISGPLSLTGYNLTNVGALGVGTVLPAWGVDVEGAGNNQYINAKGGYLVNGSGGTATHCLSSDGTAYNTDLACLTAADLPTLYYQTVDANGTAVNQRSALNFTTNFSLTDSASPSRTTVDLSASGVSAGSYTCVNATVDLFGRVTAMSSGSACPASPTWTDTYYRNQAGCALTTSTDSGCTGTLTVSQPDVNYSAFANATSTAGAWILITFTSKGTASLGYAATCTFNCGTIGAWTYDAHLHHD